MTGPEIFPGQIEDEGILIFIRRHWMAYLGWATILLIMVLTPLVALPVLGSVTGVDLGRGQPLIYAALLSGSYLLFTAALFLTTWIEHYLDVTIITPARLVNITQVGLFNRRMAELNLLRVQDVSAQMNGYFETLFQYGTVVVESAGEVPNFVFRFVPKPQLVANTILSLHDEVVAHPTVPSARSSAIGLRSSRRSHQPAASRLRDELSHELKHVHPPLDFDHKHLQENLVTQAQEAKQHLHEHHGSEPPKPESAQPAELPNRLRPRTIPTQTKKRVTDDGELTEGETISV